MGQEIVEGKPSIEWKAFFAAIEHEHREHVVTMLQEYDIGGFIVSFEIAEGVHLETNGQHMHFCVQINDKDYHSFSERLKRRFKLRGRAVKGAPAQFKCLTKIEKLDKMMAYTLKDGVYDSNLSEAQLKGLYEQSYQKKESRTLWERVITHLDKIPMEIDKEAWHNKYSQYINDLRKGIIEFHIRESTLKGLTKSSVEAACRKYIMYYATIPIEDKVDMVNWEFFSHHLIS